MIRQKSGAPLLAQQTRLGSVQNPKHILSKYEAATLLAGLCVAVSFGLMFVYAAVMF